MKGTSRTYSHSLFRLLRREPLWEIWNVATSKGFVDQDHWIYDIHWKLCKPKKQCIVFQPHFSPGFLCELKDIGSSKKTTTHHFCERCSDPRFNFDKNGSGLQWNCHHPRSSSQRIQLQQLWRTSSCGKCGWTEATLRCFVMRICYSCPTPWWSWWLLNGSWSSTEYQRGEYKDHVWNHLDCLANARHSQTT